MCYTKLTYTCFEILNFLLLSWPVMFFFYLHPFQLVEVDFSKFWARSILLSLSNALIIKIKQSKQLTYSDTTRNGQVQENLGTSSDLSFTGSNRREKNQDYWRGKYCKHSFQKVANKLHIFLYYCNAVIGRQSLIPLSMTIDLRALPKMGCKQLGKNTTAGAYWRCFSTAMQRILLSEVVHTGTPV